MDGGIKFDVSANTAKFDADMARVGNVATRASDKVKQAFSGLGGLLAGGAIIGAMTGLLRKMDDISDGARRIGISAEEFQKIGNAADLVGTSVEAVNKAMIRAGVAANKAAREGGDMAEAFARANLDPAKFAAAGLEERIKMVAEAQRAANGDARQMSELFEAIGVKAAGIDFSALAEEMGNVNAASSETVEALARANDELDKAKQTATIVGANLLKGFIDFSERVGSLLGGAGFKTIRELEEIELRAQAINQLTRQGVFGFNADENARLIAERMEEIKQKLEGVKNTTGLINEDLDTANNLEKEKTSELERQQRLLEQQESKRKEAIKDAQFEVELIEAKLRGDKARVAALEEQRDFERARDQTGSFETAANLAAAKAAERAAQESERATAPSGGSGSSPSPQSALDRLRQRAENDPSAAAQLSRILRDQTAAENRAAGMAGQGAFFSAASTEQRARERAERRANERNDRDFAIDLFGAKTYGEAFNRFRENSQKDGFLGLTDNDFKDYIRVMREQSKTEKQREQEAANSGQGGGPSAAPANPMADMASDIAEIKQVLTKADGIHDRLPIRVLAAA
jgi:hypothetical protein